MSDEPIVTNGILLDVGLNGPVPLRREIRILQRDFPDQWNLYILGLKDFQEVDQNDDLSYYQIAGIHGLPYKAWNDVEGNQVTGYCTHSSILFPTWHRPYLALFEQALYAHVLKKARDFPESAGRARYEAAARTFRMPYWDPAIVVPRGQSFLPTSLSSRTISVITPTSGGRPTTIDNPLYSYRFHPINPTPGDFPNNTVATWQTTVRWPRNQTSESQNELITRSIEMTNQNRSSNLRERLTLLVTRYRDYGPFSNQSWLQGQPGEYGSLEGVHDTVHTAIGGQGESNNDWPGHMSMVPYAAFDPAFWVHHTNVDRLCAMWQAINPNTYVRPQPASNDTLTTVEGTIEDVTTPLTPFWRDPNDFYTSADVRRNERFGHAYPETQPWNFQSTRDYQASVRTAFRNLYGGSNLGFILADSQRGRLSSGAQIQTPESTTRAVKAQTKTPKPDTEAPETETPKAETPKTETSKIDTAKKEAPKIETPKTETPETETLKTNQGGGLTLKDSLDKAANISKNVISAINHGLGSDQKALRNTGPSHDDTGHKHPEDIKSEQGTNDTSKDVVASQHMGVEDERKDGEAHQPKKDTSKDTESSHQIMGEEESKVGESQPNTKGTGKDTESPHQDNAGETPRDGESHREVEDQGRDITDLAPDGKYFDWITNLKVQKHALDGTFFVHVFLGEFNRDDPLSWRSDPNLVGTFSIFGDTVGTGCQKCKRDRENQLQITGQVPLTLALAERYLAGEIENLTPEKVVPYLQTHLHWRVATGSGIEKPRGEVSDLVVSVISNEVIVPKEDDEFPTYSEDVHVHPECTTARNGEGRGDGTGLTDPNQT